MEKTVVDVLFEYIQEMRILTQWWIHQEVVNEIPKLMLLLLLKDLTEEFELKTWVK
jgi:hypothetical protein